MKNKLLLSILAAFGLAGLSDTKATVFVDVRTLGSGIVDNIGGTSLNGTEATVIKRDLRFTRDKVYILSQNTIIDAGVVLTIEAGTLIRAEINARDGTSNDNPADPGALVVSRGGTLIAQGTADAPIIFTSMDDPHVPGGQETIPPYTNLAEANNANPAIAAKYKALRAGFTIVRGTPGVGEFEITGGTFPGVSNYGIAAQTDRIWDRTGQWGGLVWLGRANITGSGYASGENARTATATATGNKGLYAAEGMALFSNYARGGGDTDSDDQGVARFISNRYGGYIINNNAELNAFSMYGVGYNTVIEFVEDFCNKDDSIEFWGGCNTVKYAVSAYCGDDGFDTDAGWVGNAQFVLQIQNPKDNASGVASTGRLNADLGDNLSENDGPEGTGAVPASVFTLANATFIGRGYGDSGFNFNTLCGPNMKSDNGAKFYNNIWADAPWGGLAISGTAAHNRFQNTRASGGYDGSGLTVTGLVDNGATTEPDGFMAGNVWYRCGLAYGAADKAAVASGSKFATFDQLFRTNMARESGNNAIGAIRAIFGSNVDTAGTISTSAPTTLANSNIVNLDPGFTLPLTGRIAEDSLSFLPTNSTVRNGGVTINRNRAPQLMSLTPAPFVGAARDNAWWMGWTMLSQTGVFTAAETSIEPSLSLGTDAGKAKVTFTTIPGVKYSVERSTDNKKFESIAVVEADASTESYTDSATPVGSVAVFYRVLAL